MLKYMYRKSTRPVHLWKKKVWQNVSLLREAQLPVLPIQDPLCRSADEGAFLAGRGIPRVRTKIEGIEMTAGSVGGIVFIGSASDRKGIIMVKKKNV